MLASCLPAPCFLLYTGLCPSPEGERSLVECAGLADEPHVSRLPERHPSLEQVSVSAAKKPGELGHGGRRGFTPGKVIPHLAQSKPADLFRPKLQHRSVSSESPLALPFTVGSLLQVVLGEGMRSECHLPSFRCLPGKEGSEAVLCVCM